MHGQKPLLHDCVWISTPTSHGDLNPQPTRNNSSGAWIDATSSLAEKADPNQADYPFVFVGDKTPTPGTTVQLLNTAYLFADADADAPLSGNVSFEFRRAGWKSTIAAHLFSVRE